MKIDLIMSYRHRALSFHLSFKYSLSCTTSLWSKFRESLPKNIFNFIIKYLNNTLPTRKTFINSLSFNHSPSCSFCLQSETSQFIVSSCKSYLDHGRYNWRILSSWSFKKSFTFTKLVFLCRFIFISITMLDKWRCF